MQRHLDFMNELYEQSHGRLDSVIPYDDIGKAIGIESHTVVVELVEELVGLGQVWYVTLNGISMTEFGKEELEFWL